MSFFKLFSDHGKIVTPSNAPYWKIGKRILEAAHVLIAGATGCGKSTFLNSVLYTYLAIPQPGSSLFLIDPKRIELADYARTPFCKEYETTAEGTLDLLENIIDIMERRYTKMAKKHLKMTADGALYVVIDELADLMISPQKREIRLSLQKILQLGRAANIHIIACTQAPSRRIIPAELTLNFTDRIGLRCQSAIESKQIIGISGAEKLPRYGKGIYASPDGIEYVDIPMTAADNLANRINWYTK